MDFQNLKILFYPKELIIFDLKWAVVKVNMTIELNSI